MNTNKLIIPKINGVDKLYIYRSNDANDINTISKISKLEPVIVINQSEASTELFNMQECFMVYDEQGNGEGITYFGPNINNVSIVEYGTEVNLIKINTYTFVNELILNPLPMNHKNGLMYYYSVIGINEETNQMTHISKTVGMLYPYIDDSKVTREVWSCDNYNNDKDDIWELVNTVQYDETDTSIHIGNVNHEYEIRNFGIPVLETVPKINNINVSLNSLISDTFMVLEIQNPWQNNNKEFNYRKLKSYKIRNIYNYMYGDFSTPTYQSELPVSIEKMIIMYKENPSNTDSIIDINDNDANKLEIIRRDGMYYNKLEHKSLGYNQWNIPLETNKLSVYSESSIQDTINIQISASVGNVYVFDIYLIDVYQNISENTHYIKET